MKKNLKNKKLTLYAIRYTLNANLGFSLLEILMGLALLTLAVSFTAIIVFNTQNIQIDRDNTVRARAYAKEGLVAAGTIIKNDFYNVLGGQYGVTFSSGTWQFSGTQDVNDIFTRQVTVETTSFEDERKVTSTVTWTESPLRPQKKVELVSIVSNWQPWVATGGDTGGGDLTGDWLHPHTLGSVDLGPGNSATGIDVVNKIVYLSASASAPAKPDFFIVDATDGTAPFIISSLNTGPSLNGIDATALPYAYAANDSVTGQLQVIEISNTSSPVLRSTFQLPGVSGAGAIGNTLVYNANRVFIGTKNATGPEFHAVDVSNPLSPVSLGSFEVGADVNDIVIRGTRAYLATSSDTKELRILSISNPASITELGSYNAVSNDDGKSVYWAGNVAFLGRATGTNYMLLNVANPAAISLISGVGVSGSIVDNLVRSNFGFLATTDSNAEFQVWNLSNLLAPVVVSTFNFPNIATGIDYENNFVYVSVKSNDAFRIITSQ